MPPLGWIWRALIGALVLGLPAGALLFVRVPVLTVADAMAGRELLAVQIRTGDSLVLSSRQSITQGLVSVTFHVEADGTISVRESTFASPGSGVQFARGERLPELSLFVPPLTEHILVVRGRSLNLSRETRPGSLVKVRVEQRLWWWRWTRWFSSAISSPTAGASFGR